MRWAYADPPYMGQAKKFYANERDYSGEVDQVALIRRLQSDFPEGWALSLHVNSLKTLLPLCDGARVGAWVKPFAFFKPGVSPKYAWEPIIFKPLRSDRELRKLGRNSVRDWVSANVWGTTAAERRQTSLKGRKPPDFCWWLFQLLGATPDDEFHDLFPGTGAVSFSWEQWCDAGGQIPIDSRK